MCAFIFDKNKTIFCITRRIPLSGGVLAKSKQLGAQLQCHGDFIEVKKFNYVLKDLHLEKFLTNEFGCLLS